jgi:aminomethyltransferase
MGEIRVSGAQAGEWLNRLLTNDVTKLETGRGQYTLLLNEDGGVIDDLILYQVSEESFFLVVNAARREEDLRWMEEHADEGIAIENQSDHYGAVAVQGPNTEALWRQIYPEIELPKRNGIIETDDGLVICRTGYTGEDGFEFFAPTEEIGSWWDRIVAAGATPCGLGARDTLRLEKGYPLNGSDLDREHTPLEAGLGFFVALDKPGGFVGSEVLQNQKKEGLPTRLTALRTTRKGPPPRHDYEVRDMTGETSLGKLSSGSLSPSLGAGIGMAYLAPEYSQPGISLTLAIRDRIYPVEVIKKPFL